MAENNNSKFAPSYEEVYDRKLYSVFYQFVDISLKSGVSLEDLQSILLRSKSYKGRKNERKGDSGLCWHLSQWKRQIFILMFMLCVSVLYSDNKPLDSITRALCSSKCILANNFFVMEMSRPIVNCSVCQGMNSVVVLLNVTKESFAQYAYSGQPVLAKGAASSWKATTSFSYDFFKKIFEEVEGAYEAVEQECQFFPFRTNFITLRDVFAMSAERAKGLGTEKPWYVGWSNCHPEVAQILRQHFSRPHFLPADSEGSAVDWVFMGFPGYGTSLHLDYVQRPSWQAQISGEKLWQLHPPPECEHVCSSLNITVQKGDIVLINTNMWYHSTHIDAGEISITIGSEYD